MNELNLLAEFKKVLADYHTSDESKKILNESKLVLLLAPTSGGRNSIIRELSKTGHYYFIVSDTTRRPRVNDGVPEKDGVEYWFRTEEEEVLEDLKTGKFLEAEIIHNQHVSGISVRELAKVRDSKKIGITDIDLLGVKHIVKAKPDTITILMLPPSFDEWQRRIRQRGDMEKGEFKRRMETAVKIFVTALENDKFEFVINDKLEDTVKQVDKIVRSGKDDGAHHKAGRRLAKELCDETQALLKII